MTKWAFAAELLDEISDRTLYHSKVVDDYLSDDRKLILLSSKGMGKTHLLRQKRANLTRSHKQGTVIIPTSTGTDVDRETSFPQNLSAKFWKSISQEDWALIWETAIIFSVLLHLIRPDFDGNAALRRRLEEVAEDADVPEQIATKICERLEDSRRDKANPVFFVNELLSLNMSKLKALLKKIQNLLLQLYPQYVKSEVNVFIDSVDQALIEAEKDVDVWVQGQTGLAMAARNIFVNCPHIKVYAAIRQEAWNRFEHENKQVIEASCCTLRYSREDLRRMLNHLSEYYEDVPDFYDMLPTHRRGVIRNVAVGTEEVPFVEEDIFDYLYRHSFGTPRSLLHIVNGVREFVDTDQEPKRFEKAFRREVAKKAGANARTKIGSEMRHFLPYLGDGADRDRFFQSLRQNVYSPQNLREISAALGTPERGTHPFCELYNLGFLGALKLDQDREMEQHFRAPMEFDWRFEDCLPDSNYYLLHPAFEAHLATLFRMEVEPLAVISPGEEWDAAWSEELERRTLKIFISYAHEDRHLRETVQAEISGVFSPEGVRVDFWVDDDDLLASEPIPNAISDGIGWADVMLCLVTPAYQDSRWCEAELAAMRAAELDSRDKRVVPFIFEGADREKLGRFVTVKNIPTVEQSDRASLMDLAQALLKLWRKRLAPA